ncbi:MAG: peptidase family, partial [Marmoricola sp.]|nr:peptidase family [Marmoricola sp.]
GDVRSILTWVGINFVITFVFASYISWQGHVGGFVAGCLIGAAVVYAPKARRARWQFAGIAGVALLVAVATITRIAVLA